jgi:hypothetical protein
MLKDNMLKERSDESPQVCMINVASKDLRNAQDEV